MGASLAEYVSRESPADLANQVASMLDFLAEVLSAAASSPAPLSGQGLDGLATTCMYLSFLCQEIARPGDKVEIAC